MLGSLDANPVASANVAGASGCRAIAVEVKKLEALAVQISVEFDARTARAASADKINRLHGIRIVRTMY